MKKIFMLLVACVAMVFVSCSKDDDGNNGTPFGGKQISKITYKEANGEISSYVTYEYDKNGRVIKEAWREDGENDVYNYTYESDKITVVNKYDGDTYTTVYTLVNGIITTSLSEGEETEKTKYFYNENDELMAILQNKHIWEMITIIRIQKKKIRRLPLIILQKICLTAYFLAMVILAKAIRI